MDRNEISGYIQIVVGIIGILVTSLTTPSIINILHGVTTPGSLPSQLTLVIEELRVFGVILISISLMGLIFLGVATTAATFLERRKFTHPLLVSTVVIGALFVAAVASTLAVFKDPFWVSAFVASLGMLVSAWVGMRRGFDSENFGLASSFFLFVFLGTGSITLMVENAPSTSCGTHYSATSSSTR